MRRRDRCVAEAEGDSSGIGGEGGPPEKEVHLFNLSKATGILKRSTSATGFMTANITPVYSLPHFSVISPSYVVSNERSSVHSG